MQKNMITIKTTTGVQASFRSDCVTAFQQYEDGEELGVLISISTGEIFRTTQFDHDGLYDVIAK